MPVPVGINARLDTGTLLLSGDDGAPKDGFAAENLAPKGIAGSDVFGHAQMREK
ncbi:MAG: hypothetical protein NVS9B2_07740 [Steroidobacteraceae bacterium]